jgi:hypothetical protein
VKFQDNEKGGKGAYKKKRELKKKKRINLDISEIRNAMGKVLADKECLPEGY